MKPVKLCAPLSRSRPMLVAGMNDAVSSTFDKAAKGWAPATEADEIKQQTPKLFDGYCKA